MADEATWKAEESASAERIARHVQAGCPDRTRDENGKDLEGVVRNDGVWNLLWNAALEHSGACALCGQTAFVEVEPPYDGASRWDCRDLSACFGSSFDGMHFVWTDGPKEGIVPGTWICDEELARLILSGAVEVARPIHHDLQQEPHGSAMTPESQAEEPDGCGGALEWLWHCEPVRPESMDDAEYADHRRLSRSLHSHGIFRLLNSSTDEELQALLAEDELVAGILLTGLIEPGHGGLTAEDIVAQRPEGLSDRAYEAVRRLRDASRRLPARPEP